jgi:hypothetical protein
MATHIFQGRAAGCDYRCFDARAVTSNPVLLARHTEPDEQDVGPKRNDGIGNVSVLVVGYMPVVTGYRQGGEKVA